MKRGLFHGAVSLSDDLVRPPVRRRWYFAEGEGDGGGGGGGGDGGAEDTGGTGDAAGGTGADGAATGTGADSGATGGATSGATGTDAGDKKVGGKEDLLSLGRTATGADGAGDKGDKGGDKSGAPGAYDWTTDPLKLGEITLPEGLTFLGKYKGATLKDAVQAMEEGYRGLSKLAREKGLVAPEAYDTNAEIYKSWNDEAKHSFTDFAKRHALTQQQADAIASDYQELANDLAAQRQSERLAQLWEAESPKSPRFVERMGKVSRWADQMIASGKLQAQGVEFLATTAEGVQTLEMMMNDKLFEKGFWAGGEGLPTSGMSIDQAKGYITDTKSAYHNVTHPDHARIKAAVDRAYGREYGTEPVW